MDLEDAQVAVAMYRWLHSNIAKQIRTALNSGAWKTILVAGDIGAEPGVGKTAYAYYGLKFGIVKSRIHSYRDYEGIYKEAVGYVKPCVESLRRHIRVDDYDSPISPIAMREHFDAVASIASCEDFVRGMLLLGDRMGVKCIGKQCMEPDRIDRELMDGRDGMIFLAEDFSEVNEALIDIYSGRRDALQYAFMDDVGIYSMAWWSRSERPLYRTIRSFIVNRRGFARITVATALTLDLVAKPFIRSSFVILARPATAGLPRRFTHSHLIKSVDYDKAGQKYHQNRFVIDWEDEIPSGRFYALPKWLEAMDMERKRRSLGEAAEEYKSHMEAEKEEIKKGRK